MGAKVCIYVWMYRCMGAPAAKNINMDRCVGVEISEPI